jgi:cardiolipin synthase
VGNWELDVAIEDATVAQTLEAHYEEDLAHATEIVQAGVSRRPFAHRDSHRRGRARRTARKALRTVTGVGHSIGAAVLGSRNLEEWESTPLLFVGGVLAALAAVSLWKPRVVAWPLAVIAAWIAFSFLTEAIRLLRIRRR